MGCEINGEGGQCDGLHCKTGFSSTLPRMLKCANGQEHRVCYGYTWLVKGDSRSGRERQSQKRRSLPGVDQAGGVDLTDLEGQKEGLSAEVQSLTAELGDLRTKKLSLQQQISQAQEDLQAFEACQS